ncbi:hypothetical protein [Mesorhizobium sp. M0118]|uniref:hypothetical protein n=1 Tax=Mesorhizobium sp. M0118 TaxID=2956884 RepID=UPI00333CE09A
MGKAEKATDRHQNEYGRATERRANNRHLAWSVALDVPPTLLARLPIKVVGVSLAKKLPRVSIEVEEIGESAFDTQPAGAPNFPSARRWSQGGGGADLLPARNRVTGCRLDAFAFQH